MFYCANKTKNIQTFSTSKLDYMWYECKISAFYTLYNLSYKLLNRWTHCWPPCIWMKAFCGKNCTSWLSAYTVQCPSFICSVAVYRQASTHLYFLLPNINGTTKIFRFFGNEIVRKSDCFVCESDTSWRKVCRERSSEKKFKEIAIQNLCDDTKEQCLLGWLEEIDNIRLRIFNEHFLISNVESKLHWYFETNDYFCRSLIQQYTLEDLISEIPAKTTVKWLEIDLRVVGVS